MTTHVMLDLETLGTSNDAVVLSIGAVKFDGSTFEELDAFHVAIDPVSCQKVGLKIDAATVMWWLNPDRYDARVALASHERHDLATALDGFQQWFGNETLPVWGNGASFDNVILRNAYTALGMDCPWEFWHDRCFRTMKNLMPLVKPDRTGTHHDALEDARFQLTHLSLVAQGMRISVS
jgi:3' exoribonuclease, RNase T-like